MIEVFIRMLRLVILSSGFENECKIPGFRGSVDSHNFVLGYLTIWFGKIPTIQGYTLLCLKAFICLGGKDSRFLRDPGIYFTTYAV